MHFKNLAKDKEEEVENIIIQVVSLKMKQSSISTDPVVQILPSSTQ